MMKMLTVLPLFLFAVVAWAGQPQQVEPRSVDTASSTIAVVFTQMGVDVDATFTRFSGEIYFDAAAPEATTATVTVDVGSFDFGYPEYNTEVAKPTWFNTPKFSTAQFELTSVAVKTATSLVAKGQLSIKGKTRKVTVPVNLRTENGREHFVGELKINRLDFKVGEGEWRKTDLVADDVTVRFNLTTAQP